MEAKKMNYSTHYRPGCCQDLRPCGNCPQPIFCPPNQPPRCQGGIVIDQNSLLCFAIGYLIAKNCR